MSRVLVIDDQPDWQQIFQGALEAMDLKVDTASGVADGRELLARNEYALLVLDLVLGPTFPGHVPLECRTFLDFLCGERPDLPVVAVTGERLDPAEAFHLHESGVVDFFYKPTIDVVELKRRLQQIIGRERGTAAKPRVFIGHGRSELWRELEDYLDGFDLEVETFETAPRYSQIALDVVRGMLDRAGFAFLIHTGDDETPQGRKRARQNVVHETGLFQGRLGFDRVVILREEGVEEFSNLAGLQEIRFPVGDIGSRFGEVARVLQATFKSVRSPAERG